MICLRQVSGEMPSTFFEGGREVEERWKADPNPAVSAMEVIMRLARASRCHAARKNQRLKVWQFRVVKKGAGGYHNFPQERAPPRDS